MDACETRASLLARVRDPRDAEAWTVFERRYGELVLSYGRARGLQASDAEDVRQLVMAKLVGSLRKFEYTPGRGGFRRYLRTVIRGEIIRLRARGARHTPGAGAVSLDEHDGDGEGGSDLQWEQEWMRHHFRLAWAAVRAAVDPGTMEVFRMLLSGASTAGVAAAMGMSEAAVRKAKQRVCDRMREAISDQLRDEEEGDTPDE